MQKMAKYLFVKVIFCEQTKGMRKYILKVQNKI